ncbi:MAG: hypothetical protein OEY23_09995 [Acidimicrobiia bacterium]|nr:hypothetical protein [Acidimicrobiia bacterium]
MGLELDLPDATVDRLRAEASRRGMSVDDLVAELADGLPAAVEPSHRLGLVGIGASGRTGPTDVKAERDELAARKLANGA